MARLLASAAAVACLLAAAGCGSATGAHRTKGTFARYASRPDLRPTNVAVATNDEHAAAGYVFLAPKKEGKPTGPTILDGEGNVVWFHPVQPRQATDFRVQQYGGRPVLTWWEGIQPTTGVGKGHYVIADQSYRQIAVVRAGHRLQGDLHEFELTPQRTALITAYRRVPLDLRSVGGPRAGFVLDSIVQEIDVRTGRVVFEWHSVGHVPPKESPQRIPARQASKKAPFDYFHVNSVALDTDGNLLVSARNTSTVYKLDRHTGRIIWRLGGKASDFRMGLGTRFAWQHDARRQPDGTITLFDNSAIPPVAKYSRALVIRLDEAARTATLVHAYVHPKKLLSPHQGNVERLPNGDIFVCFGGIPQVTEFSVAGRVVWDAHLALGDTYRAYRFPWTGHPADRPAVAADADGDAMKLHVSWNGATEVASWEVLGGRKRTRMHSLATADKDGFETTIGVDERTRYVAVRALDASGAVLRTSRAVAVV